MSTANTQPRRHLLLRSRLLGEMLTGELDPASSLCYRELESGGPLLILPVASPSLPTHSNPPCHPGALCNPCTWSRSRYTPARPLYTPSLVSVSGAPILRTAPQPSPGRSDLTGPDHTYCSQATQLHFSRALLKARLSPQNAAPTRGCMS